jgi:hypothetical protein
MPDTRLAEHYRQLAREESQKARFEHEKRIAAEHAVRAARYWRLAALAEDFG